MDDGAPAGYFAIVPDSAERHALLSKIYLRHERRGAGLGKAMLAFVEKRCVAMGIEELWLMVNRHNTGSIAFYRRVGFTIAETVAQPIGNGFVLDDYRMVKRLQG